MSNFLSVTTETKPAKARKLELVDANAALQKALQQVNIEERGKIILRCDDLPHVQVDEDDLQFVFYWLLYLILQKKEAVSQLFLHIHFQEEVQQPSSGQEVQRFCIQFTTNLTPCADWLQVHKQKISEIAAILQKNNSSLLINQLKNGGCIFSASLPGKTL